MPHERNLPNAPTFIWGFVIRGPFNPSVHQHQPTSTIPQRTKEEATPIQGGEGPGGSWKGGGEGGVPPPPAWQKPEGGGRAPPPL